MKSKSRGRLFLKGGDDVAWVTSITMSSASTHPKSSSNSKVNSFPYMTHNMLPSNGMLLEHLPLCYARYHLTSTDIRGDAKDAQDSRSSKAYAWKRRRKRQDEVEKDGKNCQAGLQPGLQPGLAGLPPEAAGLQAGLQPSLAGFPARVDF